MCKCMAITSKWQRKNPNTSLFQSQKIKRGIYELVRVADLAAGILGRHELPLVATFDGIDQLDVNLDLDADKSPDVDMVKFMDLAAEPDNDIEECLDFKPERGDEIDLEVDIDQAQDIDVGGSEDLQHKEEDQQDLDDEGNKRLDADSDSEDNAQVVDDNLESGLEPKEDLDTDIDIDEAENVDLQIQEQVEASLELELEGSEGLFTVRAAASGTVGVTGGKSVNGGHF